MFFLILFLLSFKIKTVECFLKILTFHIPWQSNTESQNNSVWKGSRPVQSPLKPGLTRSVLDTVLLQLCFENFRWWRFLSLSGQSAPVFDFPHYECWVSLHLIRISFAACCTCCLLPFPCPSENSLAVFSTTSIG